MPGAVDDPGAPSGGNTYDRRVCRELPQLGWQVHEHRVAGDWPRPGAGARAELARRLGESADGSLVLLDGLVACAVPEILVPEAGRLRLAVLVHLPLADETGLAPDVAAALDAAERRTLRAAAAIVATSDWAARRLRDHHGLDARRVHVAAPGADIAPLAAGTEPTASGTGGGTGGGPRLLCVASLTPRKGQHLLVDALAGVADLPWSCSLVGGPGGDPGYATRVRELIARHGLDGRIHLAGPQTGPELNASYAAADLLLLASRAETYGMAVTEALARGVPVLATAVGGVPEALGRAPDGGMPGALVPPDDPVALAAALRRWLSDPGERHRAKSAARRRRTALGGWETTSRALAKALEHTRQHPLEAA
ncbi:glycosyltransferase family 4 protein [Streptomyces formicae]|uniref:D-inositol 3-phosphate glycosyltransferase n=1 Tax=Streptomyces formicae TaxID=1616117 RepID=A0ABY3WUD7_9ACTN|nr:glycosyltransferase family 4 protein [Streptomyces formicae]UNM16264.1 glycosyltransferase family 4 protein [Streptomyces formicae]